MIALVINPIAGIGGPAGLSGSDGVEIQEIAKSRGFVSAAHTRAGVALQSIAEQNPGLKIITAAGQMGEDAVLDSGLQAEVVYEPAPQTTALDTVAAVQAFVRAGAKLILFAGGDGTARNVCEGLEKSGEINEVAALGIPSGVKMYSGVFAVGPRSAATIVNRFIASDVPIVKRDVLDIDEEELRHHRVAPKLYGAMGVPLLAGRTQARKNSSNSGEHSAIAAAARGFIASLEPGVRYALGPGGTMQEIATQLGHQKPPLGIDVYEDEKIIATSVSATEMLEMAREKPLKVVVSVIGGQGFIIGRGNQQISAAVLQQIGRENLIVVAPEQKLIDLGGKPLLVDTGDLNVDLELEGITKVITGIKTKSFYKVRAADREN